MGEASADLTNRLKRVRTLAMERPQENWVHFVMLKASPYTKAYSVTLKLCLVMCEGARLSQARHSEAQHSLRLRIGCFEPYPVCRFNTPTQPTLIIPEGASGNSAHSCVQKADANLRSGFNELRTPETRQKNATTLRPKNFNEEATSYAKPFNGPQDVVARVLVFTYSSQ